MTKDEVVKLALEALETGGWNKTTAAITAIKEVLAQPEQEYRAMYLKVRDELAELQQNQPHRKPLTDEEIEDLYFDKFSMGELKAFARAIEAKLKEKNT